MLKDKQRWIARYVMANFTPVSAAIGGALIGLSAVLLMLFTGRIAGVSGIFDALINPQTSDRAWRGASAKAGRTALTETRIRRRLLANVRFRGKADLIIDVTECRLLTPRQT
jgi:uncharacterized membrane protein YedE/YeeE